MEINNKRHNGKIIGKYPASEYSDRIMNLNRLEERNLENRLRSIDKEKKTSLHIINHDIKKLEQEYEVKQEIIKIADNQEKLNLLTETLNLNFLIDKNNNFINQLNSQTFELNSSSKTADSNISMKPQENNVVDIGEKKIDDTEKPPGLLRKNLSANGRLGSGSSFKQLFNTRNRTNSAENLKEINKSLTEISIVDQEPHTPSVIFNLNTSNQSLNVTPRPVLTRPASIVSLLEIDKNSNNLVPIQPNKININNNVMTMQQKALIENSSTKIISLNGKNTKNSLPAKPKLRNKKITRKSKSFSEPVFSVSKSANSLPMLIANETTTKATTTQKLKAFIPSRSPRQYIKEIHVNKERTTSSMSKSSNIDKQNKKIYTLPVTVTTIQIDDEILQNENKPTNLKRNIGLPIISKK